MFCRAERDSDITLGDFGEIENIRPEVDDGMGTSLVIVHTERAKKEWNQIKDDLIWFICEKNEVLRPRLQNTAGVAKDREIFMQQYMTTWFSEFIKKEQEKIKNRRKETALQFKTLYLTFDDGPSPQNTNAILEVLKRRGIKATFFLLGRYVEWYPDIARQIAKEGHAIGIHGYSHDYNEIYKSVDGYLNDFEKAQRIIKDVLGIEPKIFRFPGGSNKEICKAIAAEMTKQGYVFFDWNASLEDAVIDPEPEQLVENAVRSVRRDHGDQEIIMLAHDRVEATGICLDAILDQLSEYQMKVLDEKVRPVQFIKWRQE